MPLVGIAIVIGLAGIATFRVQGFPGRFPAEVSWLLEADNVERPYRYQRCFLDPNDKAAEFAAECVEGGRDPVLLWGDSLAAHLYPGLHEASQASDVGLAQFTTAGCPPFSGPDTFSNAACRHFNVVVEQKIRELRPSRVILAARWPLNALNLEQLVTQTVSMLRENGARDIYLVGIKYVSLLDALCPGGQCVVRLGLRRGDLMTADYDHFTKRGSEHAVEQLKGQLPF